MDDANMPPPNNAGRKPAGTIDLTPSWKQTANVIALALMHGTPEGQRIAVEELMRMAEIADAYVASRK